MGNQPSSWFFYTQDDDSSTDWANHTTALHFITSGRGRTAPVAWAEAVKADRVPEAFILNEMIAIKVSDHHYFTPTKPLHSPPTTPTS